MTIEEFMEALQDLADSQTPHCHECARRAIAWELVSGQWEIFIGGKQAVTVHVCSGRVSGIYTAGPDLEGALDLPLDAMLDRIKAHVLNRAGR